MYVIKLTSRKPLTLVQRFGFHQNFNPWIIQIHQSALLSIRINHNLVGHFSCSSGVCQGTLSPLCFVLLKKF